MEGRKEEALEGGRTDGRDADLKRKLHARVWPAAEAAVGRPSSIGWHLLLLNGVTADDEDGGRDYNGGRLHVLDEKRFRAAESVGAKTRDK